MHSLCSQCFVVLLVSQPLLVACGAKAVPCWVSCLFNFFLKVHLCLVDLTDHHKVSLRLLCWLWIYIAGWIIKMFHMILLINTTLHSAPQKKQIDIVADLLKGKNWNILICSKRFQCYKNEEVQGSEYFLNGLCIMRTTRSFWMLHSQLTPDFFFFFHIGYILFSNLQNPRLTLFQQGCVSADWKIISFPNVPVSSMKCWGYYMSHRSAPSGVERWLSNDFCIIISFESSIAMFLFSDC